MSISMEKFASSGEFESYNPHLAAVAERTEMFTLQCRSCGFEPEDVVTAPRVCPKCHAQSWERFTRPGSILENARRD
jgi:predicted Zn-ribbon and HTH transcriptional regulator